MMGRLYDQMKMDLELKNYSPQTRELLSALDGAICPALWSLSGRNGTSRDPEIPSSSHQGEEGVPVFHQSVLQRHEVLLCDNP